MCTYNFFTGKKGSWSNTYLYINPETNTQKKKVIKESKGETECRRVLERYFKQPFPKCRPNFMNNQVTNFNLELDCYSPSLKIGCEYNGRQHYEFIPYFHKNKEAFQNQKYRDYMKRDLCAKNGIKLIEVPYTIKQGDIETFLLNEIKNMGY